MTAAFTPAAGLGNPHLQTLLPRFIRRKPLFTPHTQRLETPDGDFLDIAWTDVPSNHQEVNKTHCHSPRQPIMILFHGLEGSFNSPYANGLLHAAMQQGWLGVMMHFRGCSGEMNRQARSYHSGETSDARFFIQWIRQQFPDSPLFAVGVSLGGNMLVNYLAEHGDDSELCAAQVISPPLDLGACAERIEQGFSKVYKQYLLSSMKKNISKKMNLLPDALPLDQSGINAISTLRQFDDLVTAPLHGYQDASDYYQRCSGLQRLHQVTVPLRIIHAKDDPFMTHDVIPSQPLPAHIDYHLSPNGGHVGFLTGSWHKPTFWLETTVPAWFAPFAAVNTQPSHSTSE
ncbi:hydrolase [Photobacterium swingsii]|uniref:Hydrolase n=1 Tax=Photobacterium swingsii TaxID=680026 RepID=A0A0J8VDI3_9GAMM|nr:hydrolase [Photobacterium swingsii]KMV30585.1 hydrolase [Photobacterium swingsii]PSW23859.1 hydrolase [Photobacterium swingsii]